MAHKTLIGGTAYEISGGKTLIGGTGYSISGGKTLIGGTGYSIPFSSLPPIGTTLNDCTWEEIRAISDAGLASSYFSVGDRKAVAVNGTVGGLTLRGTYYCFIIGIDHNSGKEGANRIHFQIGYSALTDGKLLAFTDTGYNSQKTSGSWYNMNNAQSTSGGWAKCAMRTTVCPAFKAAMPSDLQAVLKTVTKYTANTSGSEKEAYVTATSDEVFLLSEYEVFGVRTYANQYEQKYQAQYAWYSAGNSKVRYRHRDTNSTAIWWLRSLYVDDTYYFCRVAANGTTGGKDANYSYGFAPCFCV